MNAPDIRRPGYTPTRIMPQSYQDVEEIAKKAVLAGAFRYNTQDQTITKEIAEAQCTFVIMTGMDAGFSPSQSLQALYFKDGKVNIAGQGMLALIWGAGFKVDQVQASESNDWTAGCTITRRDGAVITRTYSKAEATRAGLWREEPSDSTWYTFQTRMLGWRAAGFAAADGAPDVIRGLHIMEITDFDKQARGESKPAPQPAKPAVLDVPDDIDQDREFLDKMVATDVWDSRRHLDSLKTALANAKTTPDRDTVWDWHLQLSDGKLSAAEDAEADGYFHATEDRLGG